jgi:hypothetical protein
MNQMAGLIVHRCKRALCAQRAAGMQAWVRDGFHFESGPSLYSGLASRGKDGNPLAHVLQAIGEPLDLIEYDKWNVLLPEGDFLTTVGASNFEPILQQARL